MDDQAAYVRLAFAQPEDADWHTLAGGGGGGSAGNPPQPWPYTIALDYESALAGTVSPAPAHLEADWRNLTPQHLRDRDGDRGGGNDEDDDGSSGSSGSSSSGSSGSGGGGSSKAEVGFEEAVLVRRLTGRAPVVLHVAGARQMGKIREKMNPCQVRTSSPESYLHQLQLL